MQDVVVVGLDLRLPGPFLQPGLRAALLHGAGAEHRRRDAVEHRRLVELDERIGVLPVAAGRVATVDERDVHVGVIDQGVGERHAHRAGADDEVVGLERVHWSRHDRCAGSVLATASAILYSGEVVPCGRTACVADSACCHAGHGGPPMSTAEATAPPPWYAKDADTVLARLSVGADQGLSTARKSNGASASTGRTS